MMSAPAANSRMTVSLTGYWPEPNWTALLVRVDGKLAGFVWVLRTTLFRPEDIEKMKETSGETRFLEETWFLKSPHHLIEEFFIMRKYRPERCGRVCRASCV